MFLFAFLLLILCAAVFFLAAMGQKVCYSAGEDSNYAIFSGVSRTHRHITHTHIHTDTHTHM